jgi:hypothetical protein
VARRRPGGLRVHAPLLAQDAADLAERRLRAHGVQHRLDHVGAGAGGGHHGVERATHRRVVAGGLALAEQADLLALHLVADPQDLQVTGDGPGVHVDADDPLVALLQGLLVAEGRLGDLAGEPAVLDAAQDPGGDRSDGVPPVGVGPQAPLPDLLEDLLGVGLDPVGELLDVPGTAQRVRDVGDAGLLHEHLLGAQGDLGGLLAGQRQRLVEGVGVQGVGPAEHGGQRLHGRTDDVVVRLLGGQRDTGGLGVEPQPLRLLALRAVDVPHPARPDAARGAELGDLLEEVDVRVEEEGQAGREDVDVQPARQPQLHVPETVRQGVRQLLRGRRPGLADVVAGDRQRLVGGDAGRAVLHQVADEAQVRLGLEEPLLLGDVLLEDVRLQRAVEHGGVDALALGGDEVHAEDGHGGPADGHRRGDVPERDVPEEDLHVGRRVDRHTAVPDLAQGARVVGVAAHERRHVEGDGEPAPAVAEDHLVALVGLLGVPEPGELPDGPRPPPVAGRVQAAGEGVLTRPADPLEPLVGVPGPGTVHRLHGVAGERGEICVALARGVVPGLPASAALLDGVSVHTLEFTWTS